MGDQKPHNNVVTIETIDACYGVNIIEVDQVDLIDKKDPLNIVECNTFLKQFNNPIINVN